MARKKWGGTEWKDGRILGKGKTGGKGFLYPGVGRWLHGQCLLSKHKDLSLICSIQKNSMWL